MHVPTMQSTRSGDFAVVDAHGFELLCFLDGLSPRNAPHTWFGGNVTKEEFAQVIATHPPAVTDPSSQYVPCLVRDRAGLTLFDTGRGWANGPTGQNTLLGSLSNAGIDPLDIDRVALTHGHPDHVGGLVDPAGHPVFSNAEILIAKDEFRHWMGDTPVSQKRKATRDRFRDAAAHIAGKIRLFSSGEEIAPGITAVPTPGHSPGHHSFLVALAPAPLLIAGDAFTHPFYSFRHPGWHAAVDDAPARAAQTRRALLARCVDEALTVCAYHLPFPSLGRVMRDKQGFRWVPVATAAPGGAGGGVAKDA